MMLSHESSGTGIPLVFLHAFPFNRHLWDINRPALSKNFRMITLDLPGFGGSPLNGDTSSMEYMAQQVSETLDQLKINGKIIVIGLSMGGYVMFPLWKLLKDRIRSMIFVSTRAGADSAEGKEKRFKTIEDIEKNGLEGFSQKTPLALLGKSTISNQPDLVKQAQDSISKENPQGICAALRGMAARPDSSSVLKEIAVPSLVIAGEEDAVISPAEMEKLAGGFSNGEYFVIPKAGHLLNREVPDAFNSIFLNFLKKKVL